MEWVLSAEPARFDRLFESLIMDVLFRFADLQVEAQFNDSNTAHIIYDVLPIDARVNRWGDEIYFEIPAKLDAEEATLELKVGDIGYWPQGACLCLFFGKTPASIDERPRPASEVNLVGTFSTSPELLKKVQAGTKIRVSKRP